MSSSKIHNASPLDKAKAYELADWERVAKMFTAARSIANPSFVYVIGEEDSGPIKIGTAKCPVTRLRAMQTGNSRRLRIEYVLMGDRSTEKLLHELWEPFAILSEGSKRRVAAPGGKAPGTEWFRAEVCEYLFPILDTAVEKQLAQFGGDIYLTSLGQAIRDAHIEHDHVAQGRAKREKDRLDERKAAMSEAMLEMEAKKLAARAKQVVLERGRKGEDLTHLLADVYERLACERKEAA